MNEAELVFTQIINCNRLSLYLDKDRPLDKKESFLASLVLKRRILGEPVAHILGETEFMGFKFKSTPDVFIPRPETEILVEAVIKYATRSTSEATRLSILDIGTGSGCIAISLAKLLPNVKITATDISLSALKIAGENARLNRVTERIKFTQADLFNAARCTLHATQFDIIASNPPYIPTEEIDTLPIEARCEPRIALDGGGDGLDFYRRIIQGLPAYLKEAGFLIMEMGFNQKKPIGDIFQNSPNFKIIDIVKDYNGIDRVVVARKS